MSPTQRSLFTSNFRSCTQFASLGYTLDEGLVSTYVKYICSVCTRAGESVSLLFISLSYLY